LKKSLKDLQKDPMNKYLEKGLNE